MIKHDKYGTMSYEKVYLFIDKPVLFIGSFDDGAARYLGILYQEFHGSQFGVDAQIENYLFSQIQTEYPIEKLERGQMTLKEFYNVYPCWGVQQRIFADGSTETHWTYLNSVPNDCQLN